MTDTVCRRPSRAKRVDQHRPSVAEVNMHAAERLANDIRRLHPNYLQVRVLADGSVAALQDLLFTRAIVLGCEREGWANRYCFENRALADQRFAEVQSEDDVPAGHVATRVGITHPSVKLAWK
jgi:hypothetical protein